MSLAASKVEKVMIERLRRDGGTQPRVAIDKEVVNEYAEAMKAGKPFPSVMVFHEGKNYWLADGFHRVEAAIQVGVDRIPATVIIGTQRDAVLFAVGANAEHGMRRTNEDKRNAVRKLLDDKEWVKWSDSEIARRCCVSDKLVGAMRKELSPNGSKIARMAVRNGKAYPMETANIGKAKKNVDIPPTAKCANPKNVAEVSANASHEKPAAGTGGSVLAGQSPSGAANSAGLEAVTAAHPGEPGQSVPPPIPQDWPKWSWEPLTSETAVEAGSRALLVCIPETTSINEDLRAFVDHARKLRCAVFAAPSVQGLGVEREALRNTTALKNTTEDLDQ